MQNTNIFSITKNEKLLQGEWLKNQPAGGFFTSLERTFFLESFLRWCCGFLVPDF